MYYLKGHSTCYIIVRSIRIEGNSVTQSQVFIREMALHVGDPLSEAILIQNRDHMYNLGLFNKVKSPMLALQLLLISGGL